VAQRPRFNPKRQKQAVVRRGAPPVREPAMAYVPKPPVRYAAPFVLLEDTDKNTFEYANGSWVPYALSIAQCRQTCQVKELPQKVNDKTRYEVRVPLESE
jgi:hypothetical protein